MRRTAAKARRAIVSLLLALGALGASVPAWALYQYHYSGQLFTMTTTVPDPLPGDPTGGRSFSQQAISADLFTATPLFAGATAADLQSFRLTLTGPGGDRTVLDYPVLPICDACGVSRTGAGGVTVSALDAFGLPSGWNVWITHDTVYPTGRHEIWTLSTTEGLDSVEGVYESIASYAGGVAGSPGVWSVASVVPEPALAGLLIAGAGLLGALRRRGRAAD